MSNGDIPAFRADKLVGNLWKAMGYPTGRDDVTAVFASKTTAIRLVINLMDALEHNHKSQGEYPRPIPD